ncbi:SDR family NAD(P)-dependent oxidoreductase [Rhodococcus sp. SORGH_AS_0301]|uniref:SDR family NAD(P)-dependent oxidoreductase n=1 Tax=Rhodococcus sp. SORGH_AS_0301 TaxID=3041780 RepID=UPI00278477C0|nr:SDR family NAD(P)-dependent oxidoreductase [Rhodococcus sp. SORGH_AS_0301]MDQ1181855.1 NAD(P)-dependent dehydrogenase (short-subunit alcohol dehydrogenase family) [Rhodococcus sp. SORGH_AS_0301]
MTKYNLAGRTVVITGSTGGLGSSLAVALRSRGANLALLDLDGDAADSQARRLGPAAVARGWAVDVTDLDSVESAVGAAAHHFGRVDVVIASAGIAAVQPLETMHPDLWERIIDVNLSGVWRTFKASLPHVVERRGYLLAVSSMAAFVHSPLNGPYVASKAGVWALCDATRLEVRHHGVGVGSMHPTFFQTPMMDAVQSDPVATTLWRGNRSGLFKMVPLNTVVDAAVVGIEKRSDIIVPSYSNAVAARVPGLIRPLIDRIGFRDNVIPQAIELASQV